MSGIIPACAGSTSRLHLPVATAGDHPRMCGEHVGVRPAASHVWGSSPHVRGALKAAPDTLIAVGIIPACAGSTLHAAPALPCSRDHPRMCGEHLGFGGVRVLVLGSSPHVRGARSLFSGQFRARGIIPACAGSTRRRLLNLLLERDHPRMCGEHDCHDVFQYRREGSSPHVRGARWLLRQSRTIKGIIPACAGSTWRNTD